MKKNKPLRTAGLLLVATMLTTCMTAGTFAKYTTSNSASDGARVAKFGVVIKAYGNLYSKEYAAGEISNSTPMSYTQTLSAASGSVRASGSTKGADKYDIVAPGTKSGSGFGFSIKGKPEVDVKLYYTVEAQNIRLGSGEWAVLVPVTFETKEQLASAILNNGTNQGIYKAAGTDVGDGFTQVTSAEDPTGNIYYETNNYIALTDDYYPVQYKLDGSTMTSVYGSTQSDSLANIAGIISSGLDCPDHNIPSLVTTAPSIVRNSSASGYIKIEVPAEGAGVIKNNCDLGDVCFLKDENIKWKWEFENTGMDNADTILGDLIAQDNTDGVNGNDAVPLNKTSFEKAKVVKLDGTTYKIPTAADYSDPDNLAANDYNLYTSFDISVTVEQVD